MPHTRLAARSNQRSAPPPASSGHAYSRSGLAQNRRGQTKHRYGRLREATLSHRSYQRTRERTAPREEHREHNIVSISIGRALPDTPSRRSAQATRSAAVASTSAHAPVALRGSPAADDEEARLVRGPGRRECARKGRGVVRAGEFPPVSSWGSASDVESLIEFSIRHKSIVESFTTLIG
jgi:hypothetical protein